MAGAMDNLFDRHYLGPGSGKVKTAWLRAYARNDRPFGGLGPPMEAYRFEDSRSGDCVARHLEGYRGILQVDGYAAYSWLGQERGANDAMTLAGCWANARRKFFALHVRDGSPFANTVVKAMAPLWAIEEDTRGQGAETARQHPGRTFQSHRGRAVRQARPGAAAPVGQIQTS